MKIVKVTVEVGDKKLSKAAKILSKKDGENKFKALGKWVIRQLHFMYEPTRTQN